MVISILEKNFQSWWIQEVPGTLNSSHLLCWLRHLFLFSAPACAEHLNSTSLTSLIVRAGLTEVRLFYKFWQFQLHDCGSFSWEIRIVHFLKSKNWNLRYTQLGNWKAGGLFCWIYFPWDVHSFFCLKDSPFVGQSVVPKIWGLFTLW